MAMARMCQSLTLCLLYAPLQIALDDIAHHTQALLSDADTAVMMTGTPPATTVADYAWRTNIPIQTVKTAAVDVPSADVLVQILVPRQPKAKATATPEPMSYR